MEAFINWKNIHVHMLWKLHCNDECMKKEHLNILVYEGKKVTLLLAAHREAPHLKGTFCKCAIFLFFIYYSDLVKPVWNWMLALSQ